MQPTMKLRILRKEVYNPAAALSGYAPKMYKDTWQQWHEGVTHTAENGEVKAHVYGQWIDVPIEVES